MATKHTYHATFADGRVYHRTSSADYTHAWRVSNGHAEQVGFSRSQLIAEKTVSTWGTHWDGVVTREVVAVVRRGA